MDLYEDYDTGLFGLVEVVSKMPTGWLNPFGKDDDKSKLVE